MKHESKPGSASYSRSLAKTLSRTVEQGADIGVTDAEICIAALRYHASRWRRRTGLAVAFVIVAALGIGLPDLNGDGRASLADLRAAARQVFGLISPASASPVPN